MPKGLEVEARGRQGVQIEGTSQAGSSPAGGDATTAYLSSQGGERGANIKAVLKYHLANEEGGLWAKIFRSYLPFSVRPGFCEEFAWCLLCLGGETSDFCNFDSIRVMISFKARTKTNIINILALSKPFKQLL